MSFAFNAWYCAAFSHEVTGAPLMRRLLGVPTLIVREDTGAVKAIGDRCPHRFAPLHQGVFDGKLIECPYHGLKFDLEGTCRHNPHGDGRIPGAAQVKTYPVCERDGVIWLWPGEAALAKPDDITPLQLVDRGGLPPVDGHLLMPVDYRLVLDNLMDLSHAMFLHAGTLAPARARREVTYDTDDDSIRVHAMMRDVATPSSQSLYFQNARGDYHSSIEWVFPGTLRQRLAMTEVGADPDRGAVTRNAHLITPESATSTHYFWIHTRNRLIEDGSIDERTRAIISNAFLTEDEPMIAACQEYMGGQEFFPLQPVYLPTDYAATRCRRNLERRIAAEAVQVPRRRSGSKQKWHADLIEGSS